MYPLAIRMNTVRIRTLKERYQALKNNPFILNFDLILCWHCLLIEETLYTSHNTCFLSHISMLYIFSKRTCFLSKLSKKIFDTSSTKMNVISSWLCELLNLTINKFPHLSVFKQSYYLLIIIGINLTKKLMKRA